MDIVWPRGELNRVELCGVASLVCIVRNINRGTEKNLELSEINDITARKMITLLCVSCVHGGLCDVGTAFMYII